MPSLEEYVNEIKDMWDSHWLTNMGEKYRTFQKHLKEYLRFFPKNGGIHFYHNVQAFNVDSRSTLKA